MSVRVLLRHRLPGRRAFLVVGIACSLAGAVWHVAPASAAAAAAAAAASPRVDPEALYARWSPSVVSLDVVSVVTTYWGQREVRGEGSGFVVDTRGDIVTNEHVIDGAVSITVQFADGTRSLATVVGADASTDIAVIRVTVAAGKLRPVVFGNSAAVRPGRSVVAIGSPSGLFNSITEGIVSGVGRTITSPDESELTDALQTDAAISPGNSGGPLIDAAGRVIGVNAQISSKSGGSEGIGFAIPSNTVKRVIAAILRPVTTGRTVQ